MVNSMSVPVHRRRSKLRADPTCFPLACLDVDHNSVVLLCEVLEQDHVVLLVGVVNKHRLGAHTQYLTYTHRMKCRVGVAGSRRSHQMTQCMLDVPEESPPALTE